MILVILGVLLYNLIQWVAENWQFFVFIIFNVLLVFYIIGRFIEHDWSKIKAHGTGFSLFWWLGTIVLLATGYFIKVYAVKDPEYIKIVFGVTFGIIFLLAYTITVWRKGLKGLKEDTSEGWSVSIRNFGPTSFLVALIFIHNYGGIGSYKVLVSIIAAWLFGIICSAAAAILGFILGAIGKKMGIGLAIVHILVAPTRAIWGALFGVFINGILASPIGVIGAVEMVLFSSFILFEQLSPVAD
jgi:hypothetical protein